MGSVNFYDYITNKPCYGHDGVIVLILFLNDAVSERSEVVHLRDNYGSVMEFALQSSISSN